MRNYHDRPKLIAVDPVSCGCTECIVGEYVSLENASTDQILLLARGEIKDHTSEIWDVEYKAVFDYLKGCHESVVAVSANGYCFTFEGETVDSLPPSTLGFENANVSFDNEIFAKVKDRIF